VLRQEPAILKTSSFKNIYSFKNKNKSKNKKMKKCAKTSIFDDVHLRHMAQKVREKVRVKQGLEKSSKSEKTTIFLNAERIHSLTHIVKKTKLRFRKKRSKMPRTFHFRGCRISWQ